MKILWPIILAFTAAAFIGCGGTTDSSGSDGLNPTNGGTVPTTSGGAAGTTTLAGNYSGTFSGSNSQALFYTGTGTAQIASDNSTATLSYVATANPSGFIVTRSFSGTISSTGVFTGTTPQPSTIAGPIQSFPAGGTVTLNSSNQLVAKIMWTYPTVEGGVFYTATENFLLNKD